MDDRRQARVAGLLGLALIASALWLVKTAYETRRLFSALERERAQTQQLDMVFRRLDAERRVQATNTRVEALARQRLAMRPADPSVMHRVVDAAAALETDLWRDGSGASTGGGARR